jgi:hypothetical protein
MERIFKEETISEQNVDNGKQDSNSPKHCNDKI